MHWSWRRALAAASVMLCGLLLAGCDAKGTVVVQADDKLVLDVVVSGADISGDCPEEINSLSVTPVPRSDGVTACRITGTIPATQLTQVITLTTVREYKVMTVALQSNDLTLQGAVDVTLRFPGEVLESSGGQIDGDSVRIAKPADLDGLEVVALNRPGPESWVIGVAAGVLGTLLVVGAAWLVRRRRSHPPAQPPTDAPDIGIDPPEADPEPPRVGWSADPSALEMFAPPSAEPIAPATPTDHSIWAPPEDGGSGPID